MHPDLFLAVGIFVFAFSIPSLLAGWTDGRVPKTGIIMFLAAAILVVTAVVRKPGGYAFQDVPGAVISAVVRVWH